MAVERNIAAGELASFDVFRAGAAPYCPWADKVFVYLETIFDSPRLEVSDYMENGLAWLSKADGMVVIPNSGTSKGVAKEVAFACEHNIPILFWSGELDELRDWIRDLGGQDG